MESSTPLRRYQPVPFHQVRIADGFWAPRVRVNRERTIPAIYRECQRTHRIGAFRLDWKPGMEPVPHIFWDSDVGKWIEAASYGHATQADPTVKAMLDEVVGLVLSAQQPDGDLSTYYRVVEPGRRFTNLRDCHELYCIGHLIEGLLAHAQATGQQASLDAVRRLADYVDSVFGREPGKRRGYCGHEEIELALVKLYRATGEPRYLRLAEFFVRERGRQPHHFDLEARERGEDPRRYWANTYEYCQAHVPVVEQQEVMGHAVRAMYLYSAMADLAAELDDGELLRACQTLWDDLSRGKMYVTGGVGTSQHNEGFTRAYDLPNETAYAETCASVGLVLWGHRMLQFDCDSRYADAMERALYNGALAGVSLDGELFSYVNPLASDGTHHRQRWHDCACCPPNIARLIASVGGYAYSTSDDSIAIHLYIGSETEVTIPGGRQVRVRQQTRYPWEGAVRISVEPTQPAEFTLRLRVPGWCRGYAVSVNGDTIAPPLQGGYACVSRIWRPGDVAEVIFDMPVEQMAAHPSITTDQGRVALQRGPLVYCVEGVDHPVDVRHMALPASAELRAAFDPDLLGGVVVIEGEGSAPDSEVWSRSPYLPADQATHRPVPFRAIPYYAWDNRQAGPMTVWFPRC